MYIVINATTNTAVEQLIQQEFGSDSPGTGCSYIAKDGTFIQLYPRIDTHEDLCYWIEDNSDISIRIPDEEWAIREFQWIRLRKDPHLCIVELPSTRPTISQWASLTDWLEYVEDGSRSKFSIYLNVCDGNDGDVEYAFGTDYFAEDIVKICKRYYSSGKLY